MVVFVILGVVDKEKLPTQHLWEILFKSCKKLSAPQCRQRRRRRRGEEEEKERVEEKEGEEEEEKEEKEEAVELELREKKAEEE